MKTGRWLKVECSPSDTPPILLPRHLPPSLSFAANSLRSHMPLCDSMAGTGLPADVRRCSEWICFPPPASCFLQTQKPLPSPSFEGRDRVWRNAGDNVRWAWGVPARSVLHLQKDRCFKEQKICSNSSTLPAGDDVRWAQGVSARSVLHLQKTRSLRSKKSAAVLQHFYFLLGMMCHGAWGVPARSVLHLQKTRCLEGAGKAALELDAACPSLTRFQFHVYSNASCGSQFQSRADFSALTKSSEDFETAEALRLELPRPFT